MCWPFYGRVSEIFFSASVSSRHCVEGPRLESCRVRVWKEKREPKFDNAHSKPELGDNQVPEHEIRCMWVCRLWTQARTLHTIQAKTIYAQINIRQTKKFEITTEDDHRRRRHLRKSTCKVELREENAWLRNVQIERFGGSFNEWTKPKVECQSNLN